MLSFDANGKLYFTWIYDYLSSNGTDTIYDALLWAYSEDGGATWNRVKHNGDIVSSGTRSFDLKTFYSPFPDKEWMTTAKTNNSSNGNIYTSFTGLYGKIYQHTGDDYFNSYIMMALKKPADSSFTRFVYVSDSLLRCQYSNIETDKNGNIYIVFHGFTDTTTSFDYSLFFTKSTDSGKTFTKPVKITPLEIPLWSKDQKTQADEDFITNINLTRNIGNSQITIDNT